MGDPVLLAEAVQENEETVLGPEFSPLEALLEPVEEFAAEDLREGTPREEEVGASGGDPAGAVRGERAPGEHAVDLGRRQEGLAPGGGGGP